jgi:YrbI family 3-deoxy-D-manno-octulosonate 8-phosphate phosphatase
LAFEILKKLKIPVFILSKEKNPVVAKRAQKLKVPAVYGVDDKLMALKKLAQKHRFSFRDVLYIGNDINDYEVMSACGWRACPADAYLQIKRITHIITQARGGEGVIRELIEGLL